MKQLFMALLLIAGMTVFGMTSAFSQEKEVVKSGFGIQLATKKCTDGIELRAADDPPLRDSLIRYSPTGEKQWKRVFIPVDDETTRTECYKWNGKTWVINAEEGCLRGSVTDFWWCTYSVTNDSIIFYHPLSTYAKYHYKWWWTPIQNKQVTPVYVNQRLTKLTVDKYVIDITYNNKGYVASIHGYDNGSLNMKVEYRYLPDNTYCTFVEVTKLNNQVWESQYRSGTIFNKKEQVIAISGIELGVNHYKWTFDFHGNIQTRFYDYSRNGNSWKLEEFTIFYFPGIPPLYTGISGNQPVGDANKGGFDFTIDIPKDSIASGSFIVHLPEGFTLDQSNTKLTADFSDFNLAFTRQANNAWLLNFTPKASRNASPVKVLAHIAYTVAGTMRLGTYDISIGSIAFKTLGGFDIVEPIKTIPVKVDRWGVGNEQIGGLPPVVYAVNQTIHIQAEHTTQITIYSIMGQKLYETEIHSGLNTINASKFPQGILLIKGSSGWIKKLIIK